MASEIRGWIVTPYAGEPRSRLRKTYESAIATDWGERVHTERDTERSLPKTINRAVAHVREVGATHICWLSTGDTLHPDRFSPKYKPCPDDKGQCCMVHVESRDAVLPDISRPWGRDMYRDNQFCGSGMVVPMAIWDAVGGFDESLTYCSDWDFAVRVQHRFGWETVHDFDVLATANEYQDGLTKAADQQLRARNRAQVSKMANRLRKYGG